MKIFKFKKKNTVSIENKFLKSSYSQSGEDLIIQYIFNVLGIEKPSFIDIGAHHPFYMNNTAIFSLKGSKGINIEPDPSLFQLFPIHRANNLNLNIGISDKNGEEDFYIISTPTLNTFSHETAISYEKEGNFKIVKTQKIKTFTLNHILNEYCEGVFPDFLSVDAEGIDELIIHSIDFEKNAPIVICVETLSFSNSGNGVKSTKLIEYIESKGYLLYADTNINSIFVKTNCWLQLK
jgi:FkbM family methyltransferase